MACLSFFPCRRLAHALLLACAAGVAGNAPAQGRTLERIQASGEVVIGHRESSLPMSYLAGGVPMGYSVDVCLRIAQALARHLQLREHRVCYRVVTSSSRFDAIEKGEVDLECGSTTNTAARRRRVAFTIAHRLYDKWFMSPIPPHGINLGMRMPHLLVDSLKYPTDYVPQ